jgi:glycosyltransferase involved in cell wall biosynthesis
MRISVIIPTFNRYEYVQRAVQSVLAQTTPAFDVLVVDDASTDPRYEHLTTLWSHHSNVRYIRIPQRMGYPGKVRNQGLAMAKGDWIAFLDDDDEWLPQKLQTQVPYLKQYQFVCSDAFMGQVRLAREQFLDVWELVNPENTYVFNAELILKHNLIINSSVVVAKRLLEQVGGVCEDEQYRAGGEDWVTWARILNLGVMCFFVDEPLLQYAFGNPKYYDDPI